MELLKLVGWVLLFIIIASLMLFFRAIKRNQLMRIEARKAYEIERLHKRKLADEALDRQDKIDNLVLLLLTSKRNSHEEEKVFQLFYQLNLTVKEWRKIFFRITLENHSSGEPRPKAHSAYLEAVKTQVIPP